MTFFDSPIMALEPIALRYRARLAAGNDPLRGSRILASRLALVQGQHTRDSGTIPAGTGERENTQEEAA